jgi:F-type H+-transporting ATPase subunit b
MFARPSWLVVVLALVATPAFAQPAENRPPAENPNPPGAEAARVTHEAAGDSENASGPGTEHHTAGNAGEAGGEEPDPSRHFNFLGFQSGHVFDYMGKDEYGGKFGDGTMIDPQTQRVIHEEEPASPPFVFMLLNFALLLGLLAWKLRPVGQKVAEERHDLIKTALEEAAKLRKQAADKLAEYELRLKDADAEIKKLVDGMRVDAENEKQRILAAAEAQAKLMKRDAELRIAAEIELARAQLTREVTAASAAATEKLLREKMTAADQQTLVTAFLSDVTEGRAGSPGRTPPGGKGAVR